MPKSQAGRGTQRRVPAKGRWVRIFAISHKIRPGPMRRRRQANFAPGVGRSAARRCTPPRLRKPQKTNNRQTLVARRAILDGAAQRSDKIKRTAEVGIHLDRPNLNQGRYRWLSCPNSIPTLNADHTADYFTVGQRVKAHPATDTFMRGDVYGTIERISRGPKRLVLVKMDRSGRQLRFCGPLSASC